MQWYLTALRRFADFSGRSRRMEYWIFTLVNAAICFGLGILGTTLGLGGGAIAGDGGAIVGFFAGMLLPLAYVLLMLIPTLAVSVRRLHDTGRSGVWVLIGLIPFLGALVLLVLMLVEGTPGANQYGENPKSVAMAPAMA
jgi:uncharacterized membrane protein YhaH (DUF805 family)